MEKNPHGTRVFKTWVSTFSTSDCPNRLFFFFLFFGSAFSRSCSLFFFFFYFFFGSAFSRYRVSVLLFLFLLLLLPFFFFGSGSFSSSSSFFKSTSIELKSKKLEFHVDKLFHVNTKTRALKAWVCHRTRVSKPQDASFLNSFKNVFTNEIVFEIMLYGID